MSPATDHLRLSAPIWRLDADADSRQVLHQSRKPSPIGCEVEQQLCRRRCIRIYELHRRPCSAIFFRAISKPLGPAPSELCPLVLVSRDSITCLEAEPLHCLAPVSAQPLPSPNSIPRDVSTIQWSSTAISDHLAESNISTGFLKPDTHYSLHLGMRSFFMDRNRRPRTQRTGIPRYGSLHL